MDERHTFTMLKPDSVQNGHIGEILWMINCAGFKIRALKMTSLSINEAQIFYQVHRGKEFFEKLTSFMTSGPVVAMVLEKDNAVEEFRKFIGATNPEKADEGTIRKKFGTNTTINAIHAADSPENAKREAAFFFSEREIFC